MIEVTGVTGQRRPFPTNTDRWHPPIRIAAWLGALAVLMASLVGFAIPAAAAVTPDQVDSWHNDYVVLDNGEVKVTETIVWRFGSNSGRHGIERWWVVREPWNKNEDAKYVMRDLKVTSPDAPAQFKKTAEQHQDGREQRLKIRIGDPDVTVKTPTATYKISYTVEGALRSDKGIPELYWNASGNGNPLIKKFTASVTVPGGVHSVRCYTGYKGSTRTCTSATIDKKGVAHFTQTNVDPYKMVTIGASIKAGQVQNAQPILVKQAYWWAPDKNMRTTLGPLLIAAIAISPILLLGFLTRGLRGGRSSGSDDDWSRSSYSSSSYSSSSSSSSDSGSSGGGGGGGGSSSW